MAPEEIEKNRREFAERIITGEHLYAVMALVQADGSIKYYYEGEKLIALGILDVTKEMILREIAKLG